MAATPLDLALVSSVNGFGLYRYDTLDALTAVRVDGYFNNVDDDLNLAVGDMLEVVVWATAVRTGTISDVGRLIVMAVGADGDVDLSDDFLSATISNTD